MGDPVGVDHLPHLPRRVELHAVNKRCCLCRPSQCIRVVGDPAPRRVGDIAYLVECVDAVTRQKVVVIDLKMLDAQIVVFVVVEAALDVAAVGGFDIAIFVARERDRRVPAGSVTVRKR